MNIVNHSSEHTPELRRIFRDARRHAFTWANTKNFKLLDFDAATEGETILVAIEDEKPVGFIAWWPPANFIHSLFVDPPHIGKGAGKLLLDACLATMGRPATLKCLQANKNALAFYLAQGWEIDHAEASADGDYYLMAID
ncbi:GNAT family N-acetyltransferase [Dyadobacter sp. CY326]|uniref:GNAT family N-acetyltransferase n=1 Tax=Dyadobacter sp. CY326 TaxID=2907300 RepID=UPI001F1FE1D3|nr:GNAT family N-acetyltransferase [Dyadobacter sp. CY326]MCE7067368.1 GNAT family N-acetyltransferase [Dyadobacter sp. CY326]